MEIHLAGSDRRAGRRLNISPARCCRIRSSRPRRRHGWPRRASPSTRGAHGWHTHPLGQTLYVISGVGRVQAKGGPIREIRPGDVVWIPPGEKHWHGASPTNAMTHIAMQEAPTAAT